MKKALILLAHGSKNKLWRKNFEEILVSIEKGYGKNKVLLAYLDLSAPPFNMALKKAVESGAKYINVLPMFLSRGNHTERDIPIVINNFKKLYPQVQIKLLSPIGEHPKALKILKEIAKACI